MTIVEIPTVTIPQVKADGPRKEGISMRYFHLNAERMSGYVSASGLVVARCDFGAMALPIVVDASAIETMLKRSETLWGAALPYYLRVSRSAEAHARSLKEAVAQIEASAEGETFLAVAYQDGGLISVSGVLLPFQVDAESGDWWRPYKYASRSLS
jgi:hypothetical protein